MGCNQVMTCLLDSRISYAQCQMLVVYYYILSVAANARQASTPTWHPSWRDIADIGTSYLWKLLSWY